MKHESPSDDGKLASGHNSNGMRADYPIRQIYHLEGFDEDCTVIRKLKLQPFPFVVGRRPGLQLCLANESISRVHSEIYLQDGKVYLKDLGSRNGTYVNRIRLEEPVELKVGDIIHFACCEFRVTVAYDSDGMSETSSHTSRFNGVLSEHLASGLNQFMEMLRVSAVFTCFQPIVNLKSKSIYAYETLGRGNYEGAPETPVKLFELAASSGKERELCRLFREEAFKTSCKIPDLRRVFINIHPIELRDVDSLIESLKKAVKCLEGVKVVVEINESTVVNTNRMSEVCQAIRALGMKIAYDDFGSGQARMLELIEVPPDYLKFDRSLIQGIHEAPERRQRMVEMLVQYAKNYDVQTVAEGIELEAEANACSQMGFDYGQGFYLGVPKDGNNIKLFGDESTLSPK